MNPHERYVYEIAYDVADSHREEYETWLPKTAEQWVTTSTLAGFSSERSVMDESPEIRLHLEFETFGDWVAFVEADTFQQRFERLQTVTETLTTHLWEPVSVSLNPTTDGGVPRAVRASRANDTSRFD